MRPWIAATGIVALLAPCSPGLAWVETWSNDNDTEGWSSFSGQVVLTQDPVQDNLIWEGTDFLVDFVMADANASGGAFVGDLAAAGGQAFELDLLIDQESQLYFIALSLINMTTQDEWRYFLTPTVADQWEHHEIPLVESPIWQHIGDTHDFDWMMRNVEVVGVIVTTSFMSFGSASGRIDNFELVIPEPASLLMTCAAAVALLGRSGRRQTRPAGRS